MDLIIPSYSRFGWFLRVLIRFYNWNHFRNHKTQMGFLVVKISTKEK